MAPIIWPYNSIKFHSSERNWHTKLRERLKLAEAHLFGVRVGKDQEGQWKISSLNGVSDNQTDSAELARKPLRSHQCKLTGITRLVKGVISLSEINSNNISKIRRVRERRCKRGSVCKPSKLSTSKTRHISAKTTRLATNWGANRNSKQIVNTNNKQTVNTNSKQIVNSNCKQTANNNNKGIVNKNNKKVLKKTVKPNANRSSKHRRRDTSNSAISSAESFETCCSYRDKLRKRLDSNGTSSDTKHDTHLSHSNASSNGTEQVYVPSWRCKEYCPLFRNECTEVLTDSAFHKRHLKPEVDEKKRKRWDEQRQREKERYDKMMSRTTAATTQAEHDDRLSFVPHPDRLRAIEISAVAPHSVFGALLPELKKQVFTLPWAKDLIGAKTPRSRKRRR